MSSQWPRGTGGAAGIAAAMSTRQAERSGCDGRAAPAAGATGAYGTGGANGGCGGRASLPYARRVGWMTSIARWAQEISKWEPSQRSPSAWQGGSPSKSITMLDAVRKRR